MRMGRIRIASEGDAPGTSVHLVADGVELLVPCRSVKFSVQTGERAFAKLEVDVDALAAQLRIDQVDPEALRAIAGSIFEDLSMRLRQGATG